MKWSNYDATYMLGIGISLILTDIYQLSILQTIGIIYLVRGIVGFIITFASQGKGVTE